MKLRSHKATDTLCWQFQCKINQQRRKIPRPQEFFFSYSDTLLRRPNSAQILYWSIDVHKCPSFQTPMPCKNVTEDFNLIPSIQAIHGRKHRMWHLQTTSCVARTMFTIPANSFALSFPLESSLMLSSVLRKSFGSFCPQAQL